MKTYINNICGKVEMYQHFNRLDRGTRLSHFLFIEDSMFIGQNYRLYPTRSQENFLIQDVGNQRFLWNQMIALNNIWYESRQEFLWYYDMAALLPEMKELYPFLKDGNSQCLQQTLRDLDQALKNYLKNRKHFGFPKFHKKVSGGSCRLPQHLKFSNSRLVLPKIKDVKIVDNGQGFPKVFKSTTLLLKPSGKWFASFVVEKDEVTKVELNSNSKVVGIDLNSVDFVVTDENQRIKNPKHLLQHERRLKKYQRRMSRKIPKSKNFEKARKKVARVHEYVANCKKDWIEKLSNDLVRENDVLVIENLNVKAMQQFNGRMVQSAPFGLFRNKLTWKANREGKHLVVIDRYAPTSKICSRCGQVHQMKLSDRWLSCGCGLEIDRDHNAAINIRKIGLKQLPATVGTTGSNASGGLQGDEELDIMSSIIVGLMKEENTPFSMEY
jgi:putative transposase